MKIQRSISIGGWIALALALSAALWANKERNAWEREYRGITLAVHFDQRSYNSKSLSFTELAQAGIDSILLPTSKSIADIAIIAAEINAAGLSLYLFVDHARQSEEEWQSLIDLVHPQIIILDSTLQLQDGISSLAAVVTDKSLPDQSAIQLGMIEFSDLTIIQYLWCQGWRDVIRFHEITIEELLPMEEREIIARWRRAVRERNIRGLILQPLPHLSLAENLAYFAQVHSVVSAMGFQSRAPISLPSPQSPLIPFVIGIGVSALLLLIALKLQPQRATIYLLGSIIIIGFAFLLPLDSVIARQTIALLIALLMPPFAILLLLPRLSNRKGWQAGIMTVVLFSLISLSAGLLISALLASPAFLVKVHQFRGVKLALSLPLIFTAIIYYRDGGFSLFYQPLSRLRRPSKLFFIAALIVVLAIVILRSGAYGLIYLEFEMAIRQLLEETLYARPRFKEFLFGHPLLFLAAASTVSSFKSIAVVLGMVGQVSIINTFAHAHTPIYLSLLRTGNGLLLGLLAGGVVYLGIKYGKKILIWCQGR
ncbi:DUF5693 family protein [Candidatus Acetothermia bacterium]|nr:DUF5693 family protein [Candidatus Acetothermia bacterium]